MWQAARDAFRQAPFLVNLAVLVLLGTVSAALLDYLFKSGAAAAIRQRARAHPLFRGLLHREPGADFRGADLPHAGGAAAPRPGPDHAVASGGGGVRRGRVTGWLPAVLWLRWLAGWNWCFRGSFLRSELRAVLHARASAGKARRQNLHRRGLRPHGRCARRRACCYLLLLLGPAPGSDADPAVALVPRRRQLVDHQAHGRRLLARARARTAEPGGRAERSRGPGLHHAVRRAAHHPPCSEVPTLRQRLGLPRGKPNPAARRGGTRLRTMRCWRAWPSCGPASRRWPPRSRRISRSIPLLVPQAIRLLAWDEAFEWSRAFLLLHAHRAVGQLVDALLDPDQDFAVRRRIPRILAYTSSQRAVDGLTAVLADPRFEIRYPCQPRARVPASHGEGLQFDEQAHAGRRGARAVHRPARLGRRKLLDTPR